MLANKKFKTPSYPDIAQRRSGIGGAPNPAARDE